MNLLSFFTKRSSAPVARDRLQILLAHERTYAGQSDLVAVLREEIMAVIAKHVKVDSDKVQIKMDRGNAVSTLEVDIEIPTPAAFKAKAAAETKQAEEKAAEKKVAEEKAAEAKPAAA
jgi:cell division topological specificity factor